jgi:glycosyltransferase involved in cell wall biosynthesis
MDIVVVATQPPRPTDTRTYGLISALARRGHTIALVCGASPADAASLADLHRLCRHVYSVPVQPADARRSMLRVAATPFPFAAAAGFNPNLITAVQAAARAYPQAVAHFVGIATAPLGCAVRRLPAVLDLDHCASVLHLHTVRNEASLRRRAPALAELSRIRRYEAQVGRQFERLIVASQPDAWALRILAAEFAAKPQAPIHVLPDGVDLEYFTPQPMLREPQTVILNSVPAAYADAAARFLGAEVLPLVWRVRADVRLQLAALPLTPAVRALADDPRVSLLTGNADLRPALARATIACAPPLPLPGVPTGVLQALAMSTPVVAGTHVAPGSALNDGHELLLAADAQGYAAAILALLDDPGYRGRLARAGRNYVERQHSWNDVAAAAEQIYAAAMGAEIADWRLDMGLHRPITVDRV